MQKNGIVSVVIPIYKTGSLIKETIQSVLNQSYTDFEIIAIDDGSNDNTINEVMTFADPRIKIIKQQNQGMAKTRNNGLEIAKGEFVLFLDHDDIIAPDFLSERIECLSRNKDIGFVGGRIQSFPGNPKDFLSVAEDVEAELLFFLPGYLSTPSAYLIRKSILDDNRIRFNTSLSSTADRFFLLQLSKVAKGKRISNGVLFYRISSGGFSQKTTFPLIADNEAFYKELKKNNLMPGKNISKFKSLYFFMLAGGFRKLRHWNKVFFYLGKSFIASPGVFLERLSWKN